MASLLSGLPKEGWTHFQIAWTWVERRRKTLAATTTSDPNLCSPYLKIQCKTRARVNAEDSSIPGLHINQAFQAKVYQKPGTRQQMLDVRTMSEFWHSQKTKHIEIRGLHIYSLLRSLCCPFPVPMWQRRLQCKQ